MSAFEKTPWERCGGGKAEKDRGNTKEIISVYTEKEHGNLIWTLMCQQEVITRKRSV